MGSFPTIRRIIVAVILLNTPVAFGAAPSFQGLGDLAGGNIDSRAYGVSANGLVVVGRSSSGSGAEAFRWEADVMTGLGDLDDGLFGSIAYATSADGSVVVGEGRSESGTEAFRWESNVMTGLGDLDGGRFRSVAYAVSAEGRSSRAKPHPPSLRRPSGGNRTS